MNKINKYHTFKFLVLILSNKSADLLAYLINLLISDRPLPIFIKGLNYNYSRLRLLVLEILDCNN